MSNLKLIGKGAFTKCYLKPCGKKVYLESVDPIKEIMALGWFPDSHLFPTVNFDGDGYEMKYYPKVKSLKNSLKPKHWELYKELRELRVDNPRNKYDLYTLWFKEFGKIKNTSVRRHLRSALESACNTGTDTGFEISPRNVAVSSTGGLVLLDCFYNISILNGVRK